MARISKYLSPYQKEDDNEKTIIPFIVIVVLAIVLGALTANPIISCDCEIPGNYLEAIKSQSKGLYSTKLPLVPFYISVNTYTDGIVYYTIHYFPFGTVRMSYSENNGYNIEKPLTGMQ